MSNTLDTYNYAGETFEKSYMGTISGMQLNGYYAAVLSENRMQLHMVSRGEPIMPVLNIKISLIGTEKHKV